MLQTLNIENVALIDKATLHFDKKLNVISGETGAGKSIMLDSLSFVFGGRADRSLIRTNTNSMKVEAVFTNLSFKQIEFIKNELSINCDDELFLSRELDLNGKNICKINGELVPVAMVKKICLMLVDVHGQSEHLAILNNDYQLNIIDLFGKDNSKILEALASEIEVYKEIDKQIKDLGGNETEKQNLIDLYSYQIKEIEDSNIKQNEFEELTIEKKEMQQFEKINEALKTCLENTYRNNFNESAAEKISSAVKSIQNISEINEHYRELLERFNSVLIEVQDLNETIFDDLNNNVFDEERFNYIDSRLDLIKSLFRKYGGDFSKLTQYHDDIKIKLNNLINSAEKYYELNQQKQKILEKIDLIQEELSNKRQISAKQLVSNLEKELKVLGMPNAKMDIHFSRIEEPFSTTGFDRVEFMFSSNLGFELKPLNKVVSGGEMSRVMLAYKIVVSSIDEIQTIVFDEIDSGLSGNVATVVAEYMARLSLNKQIIAVSHLPQICAMADQNIKVEKFSDSVTTHTKALILDEEMLHKEIARLMGAEIDEKGLEVSKNLKEKSNAYKKSLV